MNKKVGRNDPCSCGSGKKYKKCCEAKHKHKKFDAQVITSTSSISGAFFNQSQSVSSLFNRNVTAVTPQKPVEGGEEKEEKKEEESSNSDEAT